ncbi:MAG: HU family DNA-binding protein [Deltaproteobacteria bacterium]|nr:HU family DNA-binding protein [Deltaproteobacteria bacterium]
MTKAELISAVSGDHTKKDVEVVVATVFATIKTALKKDKTFSFPGFGTFKVKARAARKGRNPRTGKPITIKASKTVTFKPAPSFKGSL